MSRNDFVLNLKSAVRTILEAWCYVYLKKTLIYCLKEVIIIRCIPS